MIETTNPALMTPTVRPNKLRPHRETFGKLKRFKRVAMRCEKAVQNYASFVALMLGLIWIKSVHRA